MVLRVSRRALVTVRWIKAFAKSLVHFQLPSFVCMSWPLSHPLPVGFWCLYKKKKSWKTNCCKTILWAYHRFHRRFTASLATSSTAFFWSFIGSAAHSKPAQHLQRKQHWTFSLKEAGNELPEINLFSRGCRRFQKSWLSFFLWSEAQLLRASWPSCNICWWRGTEVMVWAKHSDGLSPLEAALSGESLRRASPCPRTPPDLHMHSGSCEAETAPDTHSFADRDWGEGGGFECVCGALEVSCVSSFDIQYMEPVLRVTGGC